MPERDKCDGCSKGTKPAKGWWLLELWAPTNGKLDEPTIWQLCSACARRFKKRGPR